ncbi:MAG: hypothetical protein RR262_08465 [Clostridium sp.]
MKYIGPFLRINVLDNKNIQSQLFYLSKESIRHIVLHSGCGIVSKNDDLKSKSLPKNDDIINSTISPLLCIYRKADGKLINENGKLNWNHKKFKKEINITSNAYMTLSLLELVDYYNKFVDIDNKKYSLKKCYLDLVGEQLEFFALHCRNCEGVFIDKYDSTDPMSKEYNLTDKDLKFNFSTQALLMAAYYKYSTYCKSSDENQFKNFSLDILDMFKHYKNEVYNIPHDELVNVCFAFNVFYKHSNLEDAKILLLDFSELMIENLKHLPSSVIKEKIDVSCLAYINCMMLYKETNISKFKDAANKIYINLEKLYLPEKGIFIKDLDEKENKFTCEEIILYLYMMIIKNHFESDKNQEIDFSKINNIYKNQIINSGIILSWPDAPSLDDVERYSDFTSKSDDLLKDDYFRMSSMPNPENNELAPIFIKYVTLNRRKESYKQYKHSFDASRNMFLFFLILFLDRDYKD